MTAAFTIGKAKSAAREGIAAADETAEALGGLARSVSLVVEPEPDKPRRAAKLVDDSFPFDESQLTAMQGMVESRFACLTGAAGTGKTTTNKGFVDRLLDSIGVGEVNLTHYWKEAPAPADEEDDYVLDESHATVPSIVSCAYTGRASQQVKQNFPTDWHNNIMTIHRLLGFMPVWEEVWNPETGSYKNTMRFEPTYNASMLLPWDVVIIDEAGMLGLDLWHQLFDALKPGARIYMIGDINQLPPIYGKSVFGFAMANWPTFELSKVHRQAGDNNPIVDNAWRVIHGLRPETEGAFKMIELPVDSLKASSLARGIARKLHQLGVYKPLRDVVITPIHGINPGPGSALGDYPLNEQFSHMFNDESGHPRYIIDGGREKKLFAVGDKVMATKNDWASGITNGMTGYVLDIVENPGYGGSRIHYGTVEEVNARFAHTPSDLPQDLDLDDLDSVVEELEADRAASKDREKESRDRGPASHTVVVQFGDGDAAFTKAFESLAEVGTLQLAYVVTCHKMQGGEAPTVVIILHETHSRSLTREWLYTAITRASKDCILLYTDRGLRVALNRQAIPGNSLREKVLSFQRIMDPAGDGSGTSGIRLPRSESRWPTILEQDIASDSKSRETERRLATSDVREGGLAQLIQKHRAREAAPAEQVKVEVERVVKIRVTETINVKLGPDSAPAREAASPPPTPAPVDGGSLTPIRVALPPPVRCGRLVSQHGAARMAESLKPTGVLLLGPPATPEKPKGLTLGALFARKKEA